MIPFYLLEKESNAYPVYVDNSDLKMSQDKQKKHKIKNYKLIGIQIEQKAESLLVDAENKLLRKKTSSILLKEVSMLKSADSLHRMVCDEFKIP